jgi:CelD/BcsL family acetyltransferase involved in cellulose biosynthesis
MREPNLDDFEVIAASSLDELASLATPLRRAEDHADLFSTWAWFHNLAAHGVEREAVPLLLAARNRSDGSALCLPLLRRPRAAAAPFGPVVGTLSNFYSSLYGPIGDEQALSMEALRALLRHLKRHCRPGGVIDLQPLDTAGRFHRLMLQALHAEGWHTDSYFCFGNWHLEVGGRSFAAYESSIPSRIRNTIRRGRKKLDAAGPWGLRIHAQPGPELEAAIHDFETIYAKSWKVPEPFPQFVPGLCRSMAAQGWLRLGVLRFGDQPIAAQLWIVKDRRASIYKLAYDEDYKRFSAGSVLTETMIRAAIDIEQVVDVDYLTGDDGYKVDWMSSRRERRGIVAFDPATVQGLAGLIRHRLGRWWRKRRPAPAAAAGAEPAAAD